MDGPVSSGGGVNSILRGLAPFALCAFLLSFPAAAPAAPPQIVSTSVVQVTESSATLKASVNPNGAETTYFFEYIEEAKYDANLAAAQPPFTGAHHAPPGIPVSGSSPTPVSFAHIEGLTPATSYLYRLRLKHASEPAVFSAAHPFATQEATNVFELLDHRGWEMVSPIEKEGGAIQPPGTISGGGVFQAAAHGGTFTYSSANSFGPGAQGAPAGSQYVAMRSPSGWTSADITTPLFSGSYGSEPEGVPYRLFSGDLAFGLLSNGERCRGGGGTDCPVANPPLPGSGAPGGYRDYYRRNAYGDFESLLTAADLFYTSLSPAQFELRLVAATPELAHVILSSCTALTANATELATAGGCDPAKQNLYEWSGGGLSLINVLPGETTGAPGAHIAAASGAISADGRRVYFTAGGNLYLRDGTTTKTVLEGAESDAFAEASTDGSLAYVVNAGTLFAYTAADETLTPLTSGTGVEGVLGISGDGSKVYYANSGAIFMRAGGMVTEVASSAEESDWPPATGTARVTSGGSHLLFLSSGELTGYPNEKHQTEVFLYGPPPGGAVPLLTCVSCNPSGEEQGGAAEIPGARPNGGGSEAFAAYKPRVLSANGARVFFETEDKLVPRDTSKGTDVYEWEAAGEGTCVRTGGCVQLISSGSDPEPSYFLDADEDGGEAFFLTAASLYPLDPGSYDVYDAREGGGFPLPETPIPCVADACQVLPQGPEDPTPGTLVPNPGNPPLAVPHHAHKRHRKHGKHNRRRTKHRRGHRGGGRR